MGLGAVWTAGYPYPDRMEAIKSALSLPDHIIPLNLIPIGYPKGEPQPKDKYNKDNIHYNNGEHLTGQVDLTSSLLTARQSATLFPKKNASTPTFL